MGAIAGRKGVGDGAGRRNRRSEETIATILAATEDIILRSGSDRVSILEVCEKAEVSRGTFYRYFSSQGDLLDAFSCHKRDNFHSALLVAAQVTEDPDSRFRAVVAYLEAYLESGQARRLLKVAPEYALGFFQRIFHDSVLRLQDVLAIVFDAWDARLGIRIDRELVCEMMIRYVLSEQLAPRGPTQRERSSRIESLILGLVSRRLGFMSNEFS
ncbi:TetR/AcrR family transcriptional regulator [Zoogloea dura]|nr:TetR/AcrR family transcriptional regulator [Zoogloea dura]